MKNYNTNVSITNFNVDWLRIKSACMTTISKISNKMPGQEWRRKLLICEHSPIRRGEVSWKWEQIPYAISTHFARHHEGCEKFISTERTDRTKVDREERSQMNYVSMEMDANLQALINISMKRLCMCADSTTRAYWEQVLEAIKEYDLDVYWACVPQCVRCGGCVEPFSDCKFYEGFSKEYLTTQTQTDVMARYDAYNKHREKVLSLRKKVSNYDNGK